MSQTPHRLGKVQLQIMQVLWRRGSATAREITDELNRTLPIAHSTVQTLLRKLEAKGAVTHALEERTFVFRPLYEQTEVTESAIEELMTRLFNGSVYGLVAHLLKRERISPEELKRLRELIAKEEKP
ncbi:MAG TPA: BlaI/MecI/CopY family transcriptional regulator [Chthonomonadaceae bacterium]|nr:BlaI/MecI/CopY family transcriptional regulator [Chthonomonadaceae bacterium]